MTCYGILWPVLTAFILFVLALPVLLQPHNGVQHSGTALTAPRVSGQCGSAHAVASKGLMPRPASRPQIRVFTCSAPGARIS